MKKLLPLIILLLSSFLVACSKDEAATNSKENIVVTTTFINDMVSVLENNIEGYNVELLIPAGEDPHVYEPKASDLRKIDQADYVLYHGLNFEGRMADLLKEGTSITRNFETSHLTEMKEGSETMTDPHFWFDIELYKQAFTEVKEVLVKNNPSAQEQYEENYEAYIKELNELQVYVENRIDEIPQESRILITPHDAFGYLALTQDIRVHAPQGFSTDGEVSNQAIEETANIIVDNNIKSIFLETTTNPNQMKRLKEIVSSKGQDVELVNNEDDKLLSDSLAKEGNVGDSYITMYKHNIDTIVDNLK
jgi:manganese/zinc/iron transport system substrate-binding protein